MISVIVIVAVVCIGALQLYWSKVSQENVKAYRNCDMKLAGPDEKIMFTSIIRNHLFLPVMYANYFESYPMEADVVIEKGQKQGQVSRTSFYQNVQYRMYMMPHSIFHGRVAVSFKKRGVYNVDKYYVETGDVLGFKTNVTSREHENQIVVMPRCCKDDIVIQALGGFLGDISVRRFILEDPVLTIGFRDYTGHEPMKNISWVQTARNSQLMVKQFDHTVDANVGVVLLYEELLDKDSMEDCLEITRLVCEKLEERHIPYAFYSNGDVIEVEEGLGRGHLHTIMRGLGATHTFVYCAMEEVIDKIKRNNRANRSYIVISPELKPEKKAKLKEIERYSDVMPLYLQGNGERFLKHQQEVGLW